MTSPQTTAAASAINVATATNTTRRPVGGLAVNLLLPERRVSQRVLHAGRQLIHQDPQTRSPTRGDVVAQTNHVMMHDGTHGGEASALRDRGPVDVATDGVSEE